MAKRPPTPTPRPEVLSLLAAVKDAPEDDAARLVLADWLEEHGDEADQARAAFVRLECQAARLPRGSAEWTALETRAGALWSRHQDAWLGPLRQLTDPRTGSDVVRGERGMLRLASTARHLTAKAKADVPTTEAYAWVDALAVSGNAAMLGKLADSPFLAHLTALSSRDMGRAEGMRALARSSHLGRLEALDLGMLFDTARDAVPLLEGSDLLRRLTELRVPHGNLGDAEVSALARSLDWSRLRTLDLGFNRVLGEDTAVLLAESARVLEVLDLNGWQVSARDVSALAAALDEGRIQRLSLLNASCSEDVQDALVERFRDRVEVGGG